MKKSEVILQVSEISGIDTVSCQKVLKALEQVFEQELSVSKKKEGWFNTAFNVMNFIKKTVTK